MGLIKNVVFDFGGILLDLDYSKTDRAFEALLGKDCIEHNKSKLTTLFHQIETGEVGTETFLWSIQNLKKGVSAKGIIDAFNDMLLDLYPDIIEFLQQISKDYNIFLLSNTNSIHLQHVELNFFPKYNLTRESWDKLFCKAYYSHELGLRKPNATIYKKIQELEKFNLNETLFIDDRLENVQGALAAGWQAVQHNPKDRIQDRIIEYIKQCNDSI